MSRRITHRLNQKMKEEGIRWMPPRDKRDNKATNYDHKDYTEEVYQKKAEDYEDTIRWFESLCESGEECDAEEYLFLKLPIEERLKAPDADFSYDGMHKSFMPAMGFGDRQTRREHFAKSHKGGWLWWRVRVPSLKKGIATWKRFYNEWPEIAAEVRLGTRRFANGAKLKYIW